MKVILLSTKIIIQSHVFIFICVQAIDETGEFEEEEDEDEKLKKKKGRKKRKRGDDSDSEVGSTSKRKCRIQNTDTKLKKQMRKLMGIVTKYTDR